MSSKSLSLTLWAYARLRRVPADTSRAQLDAAVGIRLGKFNAQGLANSLGNVRAVRECGAASR
jgi:hypothetical protein